ncbi:MAG: TAT-variant-translocated molybdopterin oxidoreductase [Pirellulales bacterium]
MTLDPTRRDPRAPAPLARAGEAAGGLAPGNRAYWRSLEQLAATPEFRSFVEREFPRHASEWHDVSGRRNFLKLMAASLALAGATGCVREPAETIVPYVRSPEQAVPGKPLFFATATTLGGYARGVLVESHMGRPTKIEGNGEHPASRGATDAFAQASILSLYDPDRSQTVMFRGRIDTWDRFLTTLAAELPGLVNRQGKGLHLLTGTVTSPTLADQIQRLLGRFPAAEWHQYEPLGPDNIRAGARLAFDSDVDMLYHFDRARVVLSLDADFLAGMHGSLRYARDFMQTRREAAHKPGAGAPMNRLYVVEPTPSLTGAMADHRLPLSGGRIESMARAVAARLGVEGFDGAGEAAEGVWDRWLAAVAEDLSGQRGAGLILAGEGQPPGVHAVAHAINGALGNVGRTVEYIEPVEARPRDQRASLADLVRRMRSSEVELLVILGGNPVYTAPADLEFADNLSRVRLCIHLSDYYDETSFLSHWHIPAAHELESWSDARAHDGTATILQPLIAPLYGGKTAHEVVAALSGEAQRTSFEIVEQHWQERLESQEPGAAWRKALHDGIVPGTAAEVRQVQWSPASGTMDDALREDQAGDGEPVEIVFRRDPTIFDGRFANNGWLQELPKPLTKLCWDNAALISQATAQRLGVANEDVVELHVGKHTVDAPVWIMPGQADDTVTVPLGYGRWRTGRVGEGLGFNGYAIRVSDQPWTARGRLKKTRRRYPLVTTQDHWSMEGRDLVRVAAWDQYERQAGHRQPNGDAGGGDAGGGPAAQAGHGPAAHGGHEPVSLYPEYPYEGNAWGMVIDQTACIGCNACVVACQAENNIPIVGKEQVGRGREMHWLRIDRYYEGEGDDVAGLLGNPQTFFQPMLCMHCEKAPCEVVCPVAATVHDHEGLNEMIYNRCVGTRYCSNNCPYKVRRFNYLQYVDEKTEVLKLLRNPDVTVRSRGVMEKCTYCVQRISAARIDAKKENRAIRDGEVVTACQAACPTQAIVFGNINDGTSRVRALKELPLNYALLDELGTQPRTTYLARLVNRHPRLGAAPIAGAQRGERDQEGERTGT